MRTELLEALGPETASSPWRVGGASNVHRRSSKHPSRVKRASACCTSVVIVCVSVGEKHAARRKRKNKLLDRFNIPKSKITKDRVVFGGSMNGLISRAIDILDTTCSVEVATAQLASGNWGEPCVKPAREPACVYISLFFSALPNDRRGRAYLKVACFPGNKFLSN